MRITAQILGTIAGIALATTATAAPITFIYTGFASGSIGGESFDNAAFTITGIADTNDVFASGSAWRVAHSSATIGIDGLGVLDISTPTSSAVNNNSGVVVFGNVPEDLALYIQGSHPSFAAWDLRSAIGPFNLSSNTLQWDDAPLATSGGELILNNQTGVGTFEAILIPAPASIAAFASVGLLAGRRRRR